MGGGKSADLPPPFAMSTATVQFILFLFMAAMVALLVWGLVRNHALQQRDIEHEESNRRVRREIRQIELHRPHHILKGDNHE